MNFKFIFFLLKNTYKNKSLFRILLDWQIVGNLSELRGDIIDLGCGAHPYYHKLFDSKADIKKADIRDDKKIDIKVDFEKLPLPIEDKKFDKVVALNLFSLIRHPENLMREAKRILRKKGEFYFSFLLVAPLRPEPRDYVRWTSINIEQSLKEIGFEEVEIIPMGERFSVSANLIISPLPVRGVWAVLIKFPLYGLSLLLDKCITKGILKNHPCPIGYFCRAVKND